MLAIFILLLGFINWRALPASTESVEGCYFNGKDKVLTLEKGGRLIDAEGQVYPYQYFQDADADLGPHIRVRDVVVSLEGDRMVLKRAPGRGYYWRATGSSLLLHPDESQVLLTKRVC